MSSSRRAARTRESSSLAQVAAFVAGVWWTLTGLGAFFVQSNFDTGRVHGTGNLFGTTITVNGWHALFHLTSGLLGIALARRPRAALAYALCAGLIYVGIGAWGLFAGGQSIGVIAVDRSGDLVHAVEGAFLFAAAILALERQRWDTYRSPRTSS
ncbi:MAG: DUF4383 domain-containing protein [Solirubrobacterales bacterium]|nr:DUF4383 domain-containing protein [Solirubrobacterales bacterium]